MTILLLNGEMIRRTFDDSKALSYLLRKDVLFLNTRPYIENPWAPKEKRVVSESDTIVVFVNCNDVFAWGGADAETITGSDEVNFETNELYRLTSCVIDNEKWGSTKFACWKRNLQPQKPVANDMKKDGVWDDFMESLPKNA